jgi:hypothetical protein
MNKRKRMADLKHRRRTKKLREKRKIAASEIAQSR